MAGATGDNLKTISASLVFFLSNNQNVPLDFADSRLLAKWLLEVSPTSTRIPPSANSVTLKAAQEPLNRNPTSN